MYSKLVTDYQATKVRKVDCSASHPFPTLMRLSMGITLKSVSYLLSIASFMTCHGLLGVKSMTMYIPDYPLLPCFIQLGSLLCKAAWSGCPPPDWILQIPPNTFSSIQRIHHFLALFGKQNNPTPPCRRSTTLTCSYDFTCAALQHCLMSTPAPSIKK